MFTTAGERALVQMAILSLAKLAALVGIFCFMFGVQGRSTVNHRFGSPDRSQDLHFAQREKYDDPPLTMDQKHYLHIHGLIASIAFILFPLGSTLIRLLPGRMALFAHAFWQLFSLLVFLAAVAVGIHVISDRLEMMRKGKFNLHPIIGMFVLALLFIQPLVGFFHHKEHKRDHRRGFWSALHLVIGRTAITIGLINGYLGLMAASNMDDDVGQRFKTAYVAIALTLWLLWTALSMWWEWKRHRTHRAEKELKRALAEDGTGVGADREMNGIDDRRPIGDRTGPRATRKGKRSRSKD
ncbi:hypothetical protein B0T20DRAFT_205475 [Sordaria brevicollis]|uniref:Cytochrome b561 domain-containing protein n=1 Tax=Sordaria brevicollis TaxID=83679 RepID=A0AAE0UBS5_SORBR|nr:hypothetical protein B0T20DRAFT_205475 [Sordaria brevicollis]